PFEGDNLRTGPEVDRGVVLDPTNQISRHGFGESLRPDENMHALRGLRQEYGRLSRRVASAHDHDLLAAAQLRLDRRRAVIHPRAFETLQVLDAQFPISRA